MAPDESSQETQDMPAVEQQASQSPMDAHAAAGDGDPLPLIGAAFVGGFVLAKILKHFGGDD
ncbi:MAG TPA: hypothetical protein VH817_09030 [Thermoleophilaceae bacterium]|jgi:hypothetical protein